MLRALARAACRRCGNRLRDDRGAVAVLVALSSLLLLSIAALAVDMGNAWTQRREVQTEADLAALAGGALLPRTSENQDAIVAEVLLYLKSNDTYGQDGDSNTAAASASWTTSQLTNSVLEDGEVTFPTANRLHVVSPPSTVEFGLAGAMGYSSTDVQAEAEVEIRSPGAVMPMWLPSSCSAGSVQGDASSNGSSAPTGTYSDYSPLKKDPKLDVTGLSPTTIAYGETTTATATLTDLDAGLTTARIAFTHGDIWVTSYVVTFPATSKTDHTRNVSFTIDDKVSKLPGGWRAWAVQGDDIFSKNPEIFTVQGSGTLGCSSSQRGNFGQLDSPRLTQETKQKRLALNLALGIDHTFEPYPTPLPLTGVCDSALPAKPDTEPASDGRNCINADSGNDGPALTDGLIAGTVDASGTTHPGRLAANPAGQCGRTALSFASVTSAPINNDVLSCFLPPQLGTDAIATPGVPAPPGVLAPTIFESPRLVWVPVVGCSERGCKGQLAIARFTPCFLTDETVGPRTATSTASSTNGITFNGGGNSVTAVTLLCFDAAALPESAVPSGATTAYTGSGTRVIRLIQ